jgi:hypothetical protein
MAAEVIHVGAFHRMRRTSKPAWSVSRISCGRRQWHCLDQHEDGEEQEVPPAQHIGQSLAVLDQPAKAHRPDKLAFDHSASGQQHNFFFASVSLSACSSMPWILASCLSCPCRPEAKK